MPIQRARGLMSHAFLLALLLLGWSYGAAKAESLVFTDTVPFTRTDWVENLSIPQFNPTLGILTSVEMTLTGQVSGTVGVENRQANPVIVLVQEQAEQELTLPDNSNLIVGGIVISQSVALAANDGIIDFGGPAGRTLSVNAGISGQNTWTGPATVAPFVGVGNVTLPVGASVVWTGSGSGNMILELNHFADATLTVRYVYAIPTITIKKFTNGFDADSPNATDVPQLQPGATVTWTYLVTNAGAITIPHTSVTVTDSQGGVTPLLDTTSDLNSDNQLAPNEVWRFVATGIVQDLEAPTLPITIVNGCNPGGTAAPGNRETYRNIGTVTVPGATASDPSHYCNPAEPGIVLKKLTNGFDADTPNGSDVPQLTPGTIVTWTYLVTNTGNITFTQATVVVTDSHAGVTPVRVPSTDVNQDGLLSPGEQWSYVATGVVENLDIPTPDSTIVPGCNPTNTQVPGSQPTYFNLGRVTVPGATATNPSHYCNPPSASIHLEKTVYQGHNSGMSCPGVENVADQINASITYCFEITNTGETYLDTLVFTDTILGINLSNLLQRSGVTPLAPNGTIVYYYQTTMPADARLNTAAVEGNPTDDQGRDLPGLANPRDEDTAQVTPLPTGADSPAEPKRLLFIPIARR